MKIMASLIWFVAILLLQIVLRTILSYMRLSFITIEIVIDLVLAFVFAFFSYRGNKKEAFKDVQFHKLVAIYFVILILFTLLWSLI